MGPLILNIVFCQALWKYLSFQDDLLEKSRYITRSWVKISVRVFFFYLSLPSLFTQSQLLSPEAHNLLLVAIAFSSTILLNPNPHIDLLCTLVINYPRVKTTETSRTEAGQGHFNESRLINIFIFFAWLDPPLRLLYTVNAPCLRLLSALIPQTLPTLWAHCYGSSYHLPADDWCYAIRFLQQR